MPTAITIDSVTTTDAAPAVAPHKISALAGQDTATVKFTATHDGQLVPTEDLLPSDGAIFPDEGYYPDEGIYPDLGAVVPGVPRDTIGWTIREGGSDPTSGKVIAQDLARCSPARVCGTRAALNTRCRGEGGVRLAPGTQVTQAITYAVANDGGGDGVRNENVYVLTESQGWT